jgi:uncharacterized membrane protein YoaK (UPF0700 family)
VRVSRAALSEIVPAGGPLQTRASLELLRTIDHGRKQASPAWQQMPQLVLLLAFVAAGLHYGPFTESLGWSTMLTAALGVATLAVQNSGMRLIWRTRPSTTVMTLNLTQLVLDGIVILREPKDATAAAAQERLALVAPTLGGFLVGAAAGGLGQSPAGAHLCGAYGCGQRGADSKVNVSLASFRHWRGSPS